LLSSAYKGDTQSGPAKCDWVLTVMNVKFIVLVVGIQSHD